MLIVNETLPERFIRFDTKLIAFPYTVDIANPKIAVEA